MANQFGTEVKRLRERAGLQQQVVCTLLQIDSPMLSKIERGSRRAKRDHISIFAAILKTDRDYLYILWLTDQILDVVEGEEHGLQALLLAEEEVAYTRKQERAAD